MLWSYHKIFCPLRYRIRHSRSENDSLRFHYSRIFGDRDTNRQSYQFTTGRRSWPISWQRRAAGTCRLMLRKRHCPKISQGKFFQIKTNHVSKKILNNGKIIVSNATLLPDLKEEILESWTFYEEIFQTLKLFRFFLFLFLNLVVLEETFLKILHSFGCWLPQKRVDILYDLNEI